MTRRAASVSATLAAAWLGGALACTLPAQLRYEESVGRTSPPAQHAVHDERLRELMRGLARLREERLPQDMDVEGSARRRRAELARVARALQESAQRLAAVAPADSLAEDSRREFLALAAQLEMRTRGLAQEADTLALPELEARLRDVDATCDACHVRFRALGGVRDPR